MNRADKILLYFHENGINTPIRGMSTSKIADKFNIQRSDASAELNELTKKRFLSKSGTRPVLYYLSASNMEKDSAFSNIIGSNGSIKAQIDLAKAAILYPPHGLNTLICGASGVGKSLLAESMAVYAKEKWPGDIPFVIFSCADYADNAQLLLTQLFGYIKGAFTGAVEEHKGVVDRAQGGILFLDEIHRLPPAGQELLFILIDKGFYRRLGETKAEHKADIMLICATSEDINSSLLLTFKRRIPVQINLPTITERPIGERIKLIFHFLNQEAIRLNLPIWVEGKVIEFFAKYNCAANIGELKNDILLCCAKSYLSAQAHNKSQLTLNIDDLPGRIFTHVKYQTILDNTVIQLFTNGILIEPAKKNTPVINTGYGIDLYKYIDRKIDSYRQLKMSDEYINMQTKRDLEQYFSVVMKGLKKDTVNDIPASIIDKHIWQTASRLLEDAAVFFHRTYNRNILVTLAWHLQQFKERVLSGREVYNTNLEKIRIDYKEEFSFISSKVNFISDELAVKVSLDELGFLAMFFIHGNDELEICHIGILVAAHGRATAQNLADVTNTLLGTDEINYYNIPLAQNNAKTINDLCFIIKKINYGKGVLLLVDMGFLVTMEKTLFTETGIKVKIIPNVTTALVLEAGKQILTRNISLDEAVKHIYAAYDEYVQTIRNHPSYVDIENKMESTKKVILIICMSGHGVAEKIKDILVENIPESQDMTLINAGINDDIEKIYAKEKNSICLVIGSTDPHIPIVPFINIGDLFLPEGLAKVQKIIMNKMVNKTNSLMVQYKELYQILREQINKFAKSLPAKKVADSCETIVEKIAVHFFEHQIAQDSIVRLYLHLACMFDRINCNESLKEPDWGKELKNSRQEDFSFLEKIISLYTRHFLSEIPHGEIYYLLNTLPVKK
ncbi:sigma 54-interacting transcriptional regulator [Pectinatus frisingensis]|uniref:sigma 54-interacting transcriptional regulator n=1 Tax=Pectinatus frisingensis TaxID=865 RepID=UPI0018C4ECDB|nr:sigma 54-interacting transcriptional regulator [Pectinatus frisingensis]